MTSSADSPSAATPSGTYELRISRSARGSRGTAILLATGRLVLDLGPIHLDQLPPAARDMLVATYTFSLAEDPANGCYLIHRQREALEFAGFGYGGLTRWTLHAPNSELRFALYRSPDAAYDVAATLSQHGFEGRGSFWLAGSPSGGSDESVDIAMGRRVGPPDQGFCTQVAEALAERRARMGHLLSDRGFA